MTKLFCWDEIPGSDNSKLITLLKTKYGINWVDTATIEKIDDGYKKVSYDDKNILLKLNDERTNLIITLDNGITNKFSTKFEDGQLNIYSDNFIIRMVESIYAKYITIGTTIYLTVQLIAIFFGKEIVVPEYLRVPTIIIAIILIAFYSLFKLYKWISKEREQKQELNRNLIELVKKNKDIIELSEKPKNPAKPLTENLRYRDVEYAIYSLTRQIDEDNFMEPDFLFNWKDANLEGGKIIKFLKDIGPSMGVEVGWMDSARIITDVKNEKEIYISDGRASCLITLKSDQNKAILVGPGRNGFRNYEFLVKIENGNHCIYQKVDPKKNIIIGVDRGGAIIGGMLAKNMGLAIKTFAVSYAKPPRRPSGIETLVKSGECLENIDYINLKKILLVDDAIRSGESMLTAKNMLDEKLKEKNIPTNIVRIACILKELPIRLPIGPNYYVYETNQNSIKLPWDKMHWFEELRLEKEKINTFSGIYETIHKPK